MYLDSAQTSPASHGHPRDDTPEASEFCENLTYLLLNPEAVKGHLLVFYYGRSGSFLLSTLFDGHPEVITTEPRATVSFFDSLATFLIGAEQPFQVSSLLRHLSERSPDLFAKDPRFPHHGAGRAGNLGPNFEVFSRLFERGVTNAYSEGKLNFHALCSLVLISYALASGQKLASRSPVLVWQEHIHISDELKINLRKFLPNLKMISTVRLPEKGLDSHLEHDIWENAAENPEGILQNRLSGHFLVHNRALKHVDGDIHRVVRFEDIHRFPEQVTRKICEWVGISWHPCLLDSTADGVPYVFPNKKGRCRSGLDPSLGSPGKMRNLYYTDRLKIRYLLEDSYRAWGYPLGVMYKIMRVCWIRNCIFCIPWKIEIAVLRDRLSALWRASRNKDADFKNRVLNDPKRGAAPGEIKEPLIIVSPESDARDSSYSKVSN
jgi:hypothetical protein